MLHLASHCLAHQMRLRPKPKLFSKQQPHRRLVTYADLARAGPRPSCRTGYYPMQSAAQRCSEPGLSWRQSCGPRAFSGLRLVLCFLHLLCKRCKKCDFGRSPSPVTQVAAQLPEFSLQKSSLAHLGL